MSCDWIDWKAWESVRLSFRAFWKKHFIPVALLPWIIRLFEYKHSKWQIIFPAPMLRWRMLDINIFQVEIFHRLLIRVQLVLTHLHEIGKRKLHFWQLFHPFDFCQTGQSVYCCRWSCFHLASLSCRALWWSWCFRAGQVNSKEVGEWSLSIKKRSIPILSFRQNSYWLHYSRIHQAGFRKIPSSWDEKFEEAPRFDCFCNI